MKMIRLLRYSFFHLWRKAIYSLPKKRLFFSDFLNGNLSFELKGMLAREQENRETMFRVFDRAKQDRQRKISFILIVETIHGSCVIRDTRKIIR